MLNLWPVPPGYIGLTTGIGLKPQKRQPRTLLSSPFLLNWDPTRRPVDTKDALLAAIPSWIDDIVFERHEYPNGIQLAPPILEEWASKGRLVRRTVLTFNLDWQLAPAEDVTWPAPR
jgi:hypothetical protein